MGNNKGYKHTNIYEYILTTKSHSLQPFKIYAENLPKMLLRDSKLLPRVSIKFG